METNTAVAATMTTSYRSTRMGVYYPDAMSVHIFAAAAAAMRSFRGPCKRAPAAAPPTINLCGPHHCRVETKQNYARRLCDAMTLNYT